MRKKRLCLTTEYFTSHLLYYNLFFMLCWKIKELKETTHAADYNLILALMSPLDKKQTKSEWQIRETTMRKFTRPLEESFKPWKSFEKLGKFIINLVSTTQYWLHRTMRYKDDDIKAISTTVLSLSLSVCLHLRQIFMLILDAVSWFIGSKCLTNEFELMKVCNR